MQTEINNLTKIMSEFIKDSSERSVRLETTQEHINDALLKMTQAVDTTLISNTKLEMKVASLENKALDKLYLVEDSLNELSLVCKDVTSRLIGLELINAKAEGIREVNANVSSFISHNWFKVAMLVIILIPAISWTYTSVVSHAHTVKGK